MTANRRAAQLLAASCTALSGAIAQHMPSGPYREFVTWAFSPRNPRQQEFLRLCGLTQLVSMNTSILSGLVSEDAWPIMLRQAGLMNAYQVLEVISDNLAMGLGEVTLDETAQQRRLLVSSVNRAMTEALLPGRQTPAVLLLAGHAKQAAQFASGFDQSLAAAKHAGAADEYTAALQSAGKAVPAREELEFGLWSALVAGVEVCRELSAAMTGTATATLVRQGLADRYQGVDRTLYAAHLSRLELAAVGAQTILVTPTVGFYLAVLYEQIETTSGYADIVADGTLGEVLADASLLVRLQNDMGTALLRMTPVQQAARLRELPGEVVPALKDTEDPLFDRLHKDALNGETNVALWHARRSVSTAAAWRALADSLAYYSALYVRHRERLMNNLPELETRLGDKRASTLIERFVMFHEQMYAKRHTETAGEYAI